jgi:hypothetical protein
MNYTKIYIITTKKKKKKINRQIVNYACKRKAIDYLFSQPKKVILKELEQSSVNCSNFDETDQRLMILLFYFLAENRK